MPGGRPRELPSILPRLDPSVAMDPALQAIQLQSRAARLAETRRQRRFEKKTETARRLAHLRSRRQIEELARACEHAKLAAEKTRQRYERLAAKQTAEAQRLDQVRVRVEAGEDVELSVADQRNLRRVAGYGVKKPRLCDAEHRVILELGGSESQRAIAERLGTTQSTVSRHLRQRSSSDRVEKRGRKKLLTREMVFAAARFQFLCNTTSLGHTAAFIFFVVNVKMSKKTVRKYLKEVAGFRLGDFRRFPRERNSVRAIEDRFKYASSMPTKYGQNTLYEAIYYDEMKLTRQTKRKAWSIAGWIPTVPDKFYTDHPEHVSLLLAASPAFGVLHFEVVEGSITAETILEFMKQMMSSYLAQADAVRRRKRAFIMDNASMHHRAIITDYLEGEAVSKFIKMEFLPIYSPFLNPLEEVFGLIKSRLWRDRSTTAVTDESRAMLKKKLSVVTLQITEHDVRQFYFTWGISSGTLLTRHPSSPSNCMKTATMEMKWDSVLCCRTPLNIFSLAICHKPLKSSRQR